ncbi:helix-turn-helix domain-containing protein [Novosphingobium aquimarinum]|uniref:helix-turn-helix domain-containing protein n=1 Tax=Novosphingobium aquimarinum TaxID=2682494 RepID=UPI0012EC7C54|nr:helix-turn-helix transcriptional regulator [Novosphingobium aquimarinum]
MQEEYTESRAGERLRASIEGRGLSLAAFSRQCGVPYRSLQDYVSGKSRPGFEQLMKFSNAGLDVDFILTGKTKDGVIVSLPESISLGDGLSFGRRPYKETELTDFRQKISQGIQLRDWIDIWNFAEDYVPANLEIEDRRRQAAIALVATSVSVDLVQRLRQLGWLSE